MRLTAILLEHPLCATPATHALAGLMCLNAARLPARIDEIKAIADGDRLSSYPFYWAALGEFELRCRRYEPARQHFRCALTLARNEAERHFFSQRLHASEEQ